MLIGEGPRKAARTDCIIEEAAVMSMHESFWSNSNQRFHNIACVPALINILPSFL